MFTETLKFFQHSADPSSYGSGLMSRRPSTRMRDELKAAIVCTFLISLAAVIFSVRHDFDWAWKPVPLASALHRLEEPLPPARFDQFLTSYGPPTFEEQSPNGKLKPPLFTKWLDYEPEHLRVAFVAAESPETGVGKSWVLISFIDTLRTQPISAEQAAIRLKGRRR